MPRRWRPACARAVVSVDPGVPLFGVRTMEERMAQTLETARFNTLLLALLGGVGLLLAAIGIYGVIAYFASAADRRDRHPPRAGRLAHDVLRLIVRPGRDSGRGGRASRRARRALAAARSPASWSTSRANDPLTFGAVAVVLAVVALLAALIPARRAAALDPTRALQHD